MYAGFGCKGTYDERGGLIVTTAFFGVLVVLLAVVLAVAGLAVVQRLVPLPIREAHNAATGVIYAALYVMFGVTLGFSLLLVWQQYDAAEKMTETEAAHVEELYQLAEGFPDPERGGDPGNHRLLRPGCGRGGVAADARAAYEPARGVARR